MKKTFLLLALLFGVLFLTACPATTLQKLAQASDDIAVANQGLQAGAASAKAAGLISAQEDINLQQIVIHVAAVNDKLALAYQEGEKNQAGWVGDVNAAVALGADLNSSSLLFIKDPKTQAELNVILTTVTAALQTVAATMKGVTQ